MPTLRQLSLKGRLRKRRRCIVAALKGSPQRKGVVVKMSITTPRKPNSAKRRYARVRVLASKKLISAHPPGLGSPFIQQFSIVMVEGGSPPDTPGINYSLIRGVYDFCLPEEYSRRRRRSKFGKKQQDSFFDPIRSKKDTSKILKSIIIRPVIRTKEELEFYTGQLNALKESKQKFYNIILNKKNRRLQNYIRMRKEHNKPLSNEAIQRLFKKNERIARKVFKIRFAQFKSKEKFEEKKKIRFFERRKKFLKRRKLKALKLIKKPLFSFNLGIWTMFNHYFLKDFKLNFYSKLLNPFVDERKIIRRMRLSRRLRKKRLKQFKSFRIKFLKFSKIQSYYEKFLKKELILLNKKKCLFIKFKNVLLKKKKLLNLKKKIKILKNKRKVYLILKRSLLRKDLLKKNLFNAKKKYI